MNLDDEVCLCFRVTRRKLLAFARIHRPRVASQLSECGGAGTGCGWCVPFLRKLHASEAGESVTPEEYARRRSQYIADGRGTPPGG